MSPITCELCGGAVDASHASCPADEDYRWRQWRGYVVCERLDVLHKLGDDFVEVPCLVGVRYSDPETRELRRVGTVRWILSVHDTLLNLRQRGWVKLSHLKLAFMDLEFARSLAAVAAVHLTSEAATWPEPGELKAVFQDVYETRLKEVLSDDAYSRVMRRGFP